MSTLSAITTEIIARIQGIPGSGVVFDHDPWHREDIAHELHSDIGGQWTLRAWWVRGPTLVSTWAAATNYSGLFREWSFDIEGIEGLAPAEDWDTRPPGGDIVTLRDNAQAACDAIDRDHDLSGTCFSTDPCSWAQMPEHVLYANGIAASRLVIRKVVRTFLAPQ